MVGERSPCTTNPLEWISLNRGEVKSLWKSSDMLLLLVERESRRGEGGLRSNLRGTHPVMDTRPIPSEEKSKQKGRLIWSGVYLFLQRSLDGQGCMAVVQKMRWRVNICYRPRCTALITIWLAPSKVSASVIVLLIAVAEWVASCMVYQKSCLILYYLISLVSIS